MKKLSQTLFIRDNLEVLRGLPDKSVDLIYIDPPFNSNKNYGAPIGSRAAGANFKDVWHLSDTDDAWWGELSDRHPSLYEVIHAVGLVNGDKDKAYLIYMAMRLLELHRVLKDTGSIYFHCDQTMSHSIKLVMDAVFGKKNFINEIVWCYKKWSNSARFFQRNHDTIFVFSKSNSYMFYKQYGELTESMKQIRDRGYNAGSSKGKKILRIYDKNNPKAAKKIKEKNYDSIYYIDSPAPGLPLPDYWNIGFMGGGRKEKTGYPTQKPLALLERIIKASCPPGGIVLDPFCGCATACIAAEKLGRKWIGIDLSPKAGELVKSRAKTELEGQLKLFPMEITVRKDLPVKNAPRPSKNIKLRLYGKQKGYCNGCGHHFEFRHFHKDHVVPLSRGGQDTNANLQLLCGHCNSAKGSQSMAYLKARLKKHGMLRS